MVPRYPPADFPLVQADLAILGAWQARYGWRDPAEAVAAARAVLHCRHEGEGPVRHDLTDLPAMRAGWLLGELAALEVWTGDLVSAADHIYAGTTLAHVLDRRVSPPPCCRCGPRWR